MTPILQRDFLTRDEQPGPYLRSTVSKGSPKASFHLLWLSGCAFRSKVGIKDKVEHRFAKNEILSLRRTCRTQGSKNRLPASTKIRCATNATGNRHVII
jgi:hypothetical protein